MKMIKDNVIKEIPDNLVSQYQLMGWREYKERRQTRDTNANSKHNDNSTNE